MSVMQYLNRFPELRIAVVGDYMLDEYLVGSVRRISPEAPVPVLHVAEERHVLGGAGNVVANLRALGCAVDAIGVVGSDRAGEVMRGMLEATGANADGILIDSSRPTVRKVRLVAERHQIARYDHEHAAPLAADIDAQLWAVLDSRWQQYDGIVFSDYAKGTLGVSLLQRALVRARRDGLKTVVDPKGSDYSRYRGASALTPNEHEAAEASGRGGKAIQLDDLIEEAKGMVQSLELDAICVTRGPNGVLFVQSDGSVHTMPTQAREVFDVTGAGDTYISAFTAAVVAGAPYPDAAELGNRAAGLAVARVGTAVISCTDLTSSMSHNRKICTVGEIEQVGRALHASGKRIVFTNGCFDLLHAGHVKYLERARSLGDCLVLGLNTDASVRRLKGPSRPLVEEQDRAMVLASLRSVDYVVLFDEDTPLRLIETVRPDILAKGADYSVDRVVGHELVESWGGRVELIDFVEGRSTTKIIGSILERHVKEHGNGVD